VTLTDKRHNKPEDAILVVDSPWAVCKLDRGIFVDYPCRKIILVDQGQNTEKYFSEDDLILSCSLMDTRGLNEVYHRLAQTFKVIAVLGFSEASVFATAYLAEAFDVSGIGVEAALACRNKHTMVEQLTQNGVTTPNYFLISSSGDLACNTLVSRVDAIGGFPVICKPLMGFASSGVIRADNPTGLVKAIRKIRLNNKVIMARYYEGTKAINQVLVQAYIPGTEVAIDGYVQDGQAHVLTIIDKPNVSQGPFFGDDMHVLPSLLPEEQASAAKQLAQDCVTSLGLNDTPIHLEARISDGTLYVLEIAARMGFMHSIHDAFGLDMCAITLALKMGLQPQVRPRWRRFAGNYCIKANELGFFVRIGNKEAIVADPRIVALPVFVKPGDRVAPPPEGNAYIGYILAAADSYDEVERALSLAAQNIQVILE